MAEQSPPSTHGPNIVDLRAERERRQGLATREVTSVAPSELTRAVVERGQPLLEAGLDRAQASELLRVSVRRMRGWERAGLLRPSLAQGRYTFADLRGARVLAAMSKLKLSLEQMRTMIEGLQRLLADERPAIALRIRVEGRSVLARDDKGSFDVRSGQGVLDFETGIAVVRAIGQATSGPHDRTAYEWFLEGCRLDGDEATRVRAVSAYRRAVTLDETLAPAWTNLGALYLADGEPDEARKCFELAMEADPAQAEAPYNLGFLHVEAHEYERALTLLAQAIAMEPTFADAHFNLAVALDELSRHTEARAHWEMYLELVSDGPYAEVARKRLRRRDP
ncbi:MAG: tetratricopeptide repeat protein [Deltaproteobacteria bacterium]|nr:tetratricopeptide repeat protein [Deltaproteobacteria bacterium]